MDPFSAIGLAGNIVQFVDFGCKLFSATHDIYQSKTGLASDVEGINTITADLENICAKLTQSTSQKATTDDEVRLIPLALQCRQLATGMLDTLSGLALKKEQSKWKSLKAALKTVWKQEEINRMQSQLDGFRMQLVLRLQAMSSSSGSTAEALSRLQKQNLQMEAKFQQDLEQLQSDVKLLLKRMEHDLATGTRISMQSKPNTPMSDYSADLAKLSARGEYYIKAVELLRSLFYDSMGFRYAKVAKAHARTYDWAYKISFASWMKSDEQLFWVSGKPGCGKSTLMKFLINNPRTEKCLQQWAGRRKLMIASYFFWINGNDLQRSQEGLLRSILFDMLRRWPELLDVALNSKDGSSTGQFATFEGLRPSTWTLDSLSTTLELLMRTFKDTHCFSLFIDGLDEYDGDLELLTAFIRRLQQFNNIKLCLASRPWNVFESAFGSDTKNKIYVQDLTSSDITRYVRDKLEGHSQFHKSKQEGANMDELVAEVVKKAQGVFLWIYLVVSSLLQGLHNADRVIDLRRRLDTFPADLKDYFRYILDSLDPIYRCQTAQGFRTVLAAPNRLSVLHFWYLDHEEENPNYAIEMSIPKVSEVPNLQRRELARAMTMGKRLNGRFKGLLEITNERSGRYYLGEDGHTVTSNELKVDFLHRTVRDFLSSPAPAAMLEEWTPEDFHPQESICKAYIADLKDCCARKECLMNSHHFTGLVKNIFAVSRAHEVETGCRLTYLLSELSRVVNSPSPGISQMTLWQMLEVGSFEDFALANNALDALEASKSSAGKKNKVQRDEGWYHFSRATTPYDTQVQIQPHSNDMVAQDNMQTTVQSSETSLQVPTSPAHGILSPAARVSRKTSILRVPSIRKKMLQPFRGSKVAQG